MKRILIGIAAVFCAQAAFQTQLAVERTEIEYASLVTPLAKPVATDNILLADLTVREPAQIDVPSIVRTRYIVRQPTTRPVHAKLRRPAKHNIESTVAAFKPVIITPSSTPVKVIYKTESPSEKRGFPSKALAVIKKPYGWLKAVASRFN